MPRMDCKDCDQCDGKCRRDKPFVPLDELPDEEQENLLRKINAFLGNVLTERLFSSVPIEQPDMK